jgi:large conductance mechanosensitive channel
MSGFKKFLTRGNLIDLAVAVVIGVAFNAIVTALVTDLITPLIAAAGGGHVSFANLSVHLNHQKIPYGLVLNAALSFLVIAAVVYYLIVAPSDRLTTRLARNKAATTRDCPECLSTIPIAATRCMYCTTEVPPVPAPADVPQPRRSRHGQVPTEESSS